MNLIVLLIAIAVAIYFLRREGRKEIEQRTKSQHAGRDWQSIVDKAKDIAALHERPAIGLQVTDERNSDDAHSCIGGRPSLPAGMGWPLDEDQRPMLFLAQINFAEMPAREGYPASGLISFFVMDDDLNGCAFPSIGSDGFAVHYFDSADALVRHPFPDTNWEFSPLSETLLKEGRRLVGKVQRGPLSFNSAVVADISEGWYPDCPRAQWDDFHAALSKDNTSVVYYGGHPDFTQSDFRNPNDEPAYSEVLLQMGFLHGKEKGIEVCWGDAGEACFMVPKDDLAQKRFDRVAYNWDCG